MDEEHDFDDDRHVEEGSNSESDANESDDSDSDPDDHEADEGDFIEESSDDSDQADLDSDTDDSDDEEELANEDPAREVERLLLDYPQVKEALMQNNVDAMRLLVNEGFDVNVNNTISLFFAISSGNLEMVKCLLDAGAKRDCVLDCFKKLPKVGLLNLAIRTKDSSVRWAMIRLLIDSGVSARDDEHLGESFIHEAVYCEDVELIKFLFDAGAEVNRINSRGLAPINLAIFVAKTQSLEMVKQLIKIGADVNVKDESGHTCLHMVVRLDSNRCELAKVLLEAGAQLNCISKDNMTPLALAALSRDCELMKLLIDAGAEINRTKLLEGSALAIAILRRHKDAVELLLKHGADINANGNYYSALNLALIEVKGTSNMAEYMEVLKFILAHTAYTSYTEAEKLMTLKCLFRLGTIEALHLLRENGIKLENCAIVYPLHEAAHNFRAEILEYLLKTHLYDINEYDDDGSTALIVAISQNNTACVKILLEWGADVEKSSTTPINGALSSPVYWAVLKKNETILNLLMAVGAKPNLNHINEDGKHHIDTSKSNKVNKCLTARSILLAGQDQPEIDPHYSWFRKKHSSKFANKCLSELKILKSHVLYSSVSLYDVLKGTDITGFVNNVHVTEKFISLNVIGNFPVYGEQISVCYSMSRVKRGVMDDAVKGLSKILGDRFRNSYLINRCILLHLGMKDLRHLCNV